MRAAITPDELDHAAVAAASIVDEPFDVALECSGHAAAMEQCLGQLKRTGRLVLVGAGIKPPRFDPNRILLNELVITGAFCYDGDGFERALEMLASSRASRATCSSSRTTCRLERPARRAIEALGAGEIPAKVMIAPKRGRMSDRDDRARSSRDAAVQPCRDERARRPARRGATARARATSTARCSAWHELPTETVDRQEARLRRARRSSSSCSSSPTTRR